MSFVSFGDHHGSVHRYPSSKYPPWSLSRVVGDTLDPGKHWYVLTKHLCGVRPKEFAASEFFDIIAIIETKYSLLRQKI